MFQVRRACRRVDRAAPEFAMLPVVESVAVGRELEPRVGDAALGNLDVVLRLLDVGALVERGSARRRLWMVDSISVERDAARGRRTPPGSPAPARAPRAPGAGPRRRSPAWPARRPRSAAARSTSSWVAVPSLNWRWVRLSHRERAAQAGRLTSAVRSAVKTEMMELATPAKMVRFWSSSASFGRGLRPSPWS